MRQSELRWIVARPSIVVGDSRSGAVRKFEAIYGVFKLTADGQVRHLPARSDATLDLVPIDNVGLGLVALADYRERAYDPSHLAPVLQCLDPVPPFQPALTRFLG